MQNSVRVQSALSFKKATNPMPAMSAHSPHPRALYEEVAELLRQRIFNRELEPGSWIDELKIAEELRHQPHPAARSAQGAGRRRPGDHEGAPRRLRDRSVRERPAPRSTTCWPARIGRGRRGGRNGPPTPNWPSCKRCTRAGRPPPDRPRPLLRHQRAFHMRLLEMADNRWRSRWWPTCARS
jgi:hypothetical protein